MVDANDSVYTSATNDVLAAGLLHTVAVQCLQAVTQRCVSPSGEELLDRWTDPHISRASKRRRLNLCIAFVTREYLAAAGGGGISRQASTIVERLEYRCLLLPEALTELARVWESRLPEHFESPALTTRYVGAQWRIGVPLASSEPAEIGEPMVTIALHTRDFLGQAADTRFLELSIGEIKALTRAVRAASIDIG